MECPKCNSTNTFKSTFAMDPYYKCCDCGYSEILTPFTPNITFIEDKNMKGSVKGAFIHFVCSCGWMSEVISVDFSLQTTGKIPKCPKCENNG